MNARCPTHNTELQCLDCLAEQGKQASLDRKRRREEAKRRSEHGRNCPMCGEYIPPGYGALTCSRACRIELQAISARRVWAWRWPRGPQERPCAVCGKPYKPQQSRVLTCSRACGAKLAWSRRKADSTAMLPPSPCLLIGYHQTPFPCQNRE